jgi:hypothetical protein
VHRSLVQLGRGVVVGRGLVAVAEVGSSHDRRDVVGRRRLDLGGGRSVDLGGDLTVRAVLDGGRTSTDGEVLGGVKSGSHGSVNDLGLGHGADSGGESDGLGDNVRALAVAVGSTRGASSDGADGGCVDGRGGVTSCDDLSWDGVRRVAAGGLARSRLIGLARLSRLLGLLRVGRLLASRLSRSSLFLSDRADGGRDSNSLGDNLRSRRAVGNLRATGSDSSDTGSVDSGGGVTGSLGCWLGDMRLSWLGLSWLGLGGLGLSDVRLSLLLGNRADGSGNSDSLSGDMRSNRAVGNIRCTRGNGANVGGVNSRGGPLSSRGNSRLSRSSFGLASGDRLGSGLSLSSRDGLGGVLLSSRLGGLFLGGRLSNNLSRSNGLGRSVLSDDDLGNRRNDLSDRADSGRDGDGLGGDVRANGTVRHIGSTRSDGAHVGGVDGWGSHLSGASGLGRSGLILSAGDGVGRDSSALGGDGVLVAIGGGRDGLGLGELLLGRGLGGSLVVGDGLGRLLLRLSSSRNSLGGGLVAGLGGRNSRGFGLSGRLVTSLSSGLGRLLLGSRDSLGDGLVLSDSHRLGRLSFSDRANSRWDSDGLSRDALVVRAVRNLGRAISDGADSSRVDSWSGPLAGCLDGRLGLAGLLSLGVGLGRRVDTGGGLGGLSRSSSGSSLSLAREGLGLSLSGDGFGLSRNRNGALRRRVSTRGSSSLSNLRDLLGLSLDTLGGRLGRRRVNTSGRLLRNLLGLGLSLNRQRSSSSLSVLLLGGSRNLVLGSRNRSLTLLSDRADSSRYSDGLGSDVLVVGAVGDLRRARCHSVHVGGVNSWGSPLSGRGALGLDGSGLGILGGLVGNLGGSALGCGLCDGTLGRGIGISGAADNGGSLLGHIGALGRSVLGSRSESLGGILDRLGSSGRRVQVSGGGDTSSSSIGGDISGRLLSRFSGGNTLGRRVDTSDRGSLGGSLLFSLSGVFGRLGSSRRRVEISSGSSISGSLLFFLRWRCALRRRVGTRGRRGFSSSLLSSLGSRNSLGRRISVRGGVGGRRVNTRSLFFGRLGLSSSRLRRSGFGSNDSRTSRGGIIGSILLNDRRGGHFNDRNLGGRLRRRNILRGFLRSRLSVARNIGRRIDIGLSVGRRRVSILRRQIVVSSKLVSTEI